MFTNQLLNEFIISRSAGTSQKTITYYHYTLDRFIGYPLYDKDEEHLLRRLTDDDLAGQFEQNSILAYQDYTEWFIKTSFLPHLYAEWPQELRDKGLYIVAEEQPYQLIEILRLLTERKTFKGTCPVCKDW